VQARDTRVVGQFESLLWESRPRRLMRYRSGRRVVGSVPNPLTEWTAGPVGRLGRPLLVEIEAYLEFFAIARSDEPRKDLYQTSAR
jgi:hypothetical protein